MVPDRQKGWTDGRTEGRTEWTDGRTDNAKTISLRLRRGIKISIDLWCLYLMQHMLHQIKGPQFYIDLGFQKHC